VDYKKQASVNVKSATAVAIIGAGPYGLSLAAHLSKRGVPYRIFGPPMQVWRTQMPDGMRLKSDGFASDLYDPDRRFTLGQYCRNHGIAYADYGMPVRRETFVAYALAFQKKFVPTLEPAYVVNVRRAAGAFALRLQDGETFAARAIVMATGISYFSHVPEPLSALPAELCTHSSAHYDLSAFRNRRVVVVGGGASAIDLAALLHSGGAAVHLVTRSPLKFHLPPGDKPRSLWNRIAEPNLGLGPGFRSAVFTAVPGLIHRLPRRLRLYIVQRYLGPSGGWFMKDQVIGKVQLHVGYVVQVATARRGAVELRLSGEHGHSKEIKADHVIAATGYQVSIAQLGILQQQLRSELQLEAQSPVLSPAFESSVSGLYFVGVASANSFGPVMRFALGAEYTANRLGDHLAGVHAGLPVKSLSITESS
jgi:thioredoxin reductase